MPIETHTDYTWRGRRFEGVAGAQALWHDGGRMVKGWVVIVRGGSPTDYPQCEIAIALTIWTFEDHPRGETPLGLPLETPLRMQWRRMREDKKKPPPDGGGIRSKCDDSFNT